MTTQAIAVQPGRTVRDVLLAGLGGLAAPHLAAVGWGLLSSALWGAGWRLAVFVNPAAALPAGYLPLSLMFAAALGTLLGVTLALALDRRGAVGGWWLWAAFAVGVTVAAAGVDVASLRQPVQLLLIASSALGFRLGARR
jgi:hypothetical protein